MIIIYRRQDRDFTHITLIVKTQMRHPQVYIINQIQGLYLMPNKAPKQSINILILSNHKIKFNNSLNYYKLLANLTIVN